MRNGILAIFAMATLVTACASTQENPDAGMTEAAPAAETAPAAAPAAEAAPAEATAPAQ